MTLNITPCFILHERLLSWQQEEKSPGLQHKSFLWDKNRLYIKVELLTFFSLWRQWLWVSDVRIYCYITNYGGASVGSRVKLSYATCLYNGGFLFFLSATKLNFTHVHAVNLCTILDPTSPLYVPSVKRRSHSFFSLLDSNWLIICDSYQVLDQTVLQKVWSYF